MSTISDDPEESFPTRPSGERMWLRGRNLVVLGGISLAVFLWTKHPAAAAVFPLVLAGRRCWNVGWWLHDRDPDRRRAAVVLKFYLALCGWQAAVAAFATVVGCVYLEEAGWWKIPEERMMWTFLVLLAGLIWNGCWCLVALVSARRLRLRIWLSPGLIHRCGGEFERLSELGEDTKFLNWAVFVIAGGVAFPLLMVFSIAMVIVMLPWGGGAVVDVVRLALFLVILLAMPIVAIGLVLTLMAQLSARSPSECWGQPTGLESLAE